MAPSAIGFCDLLGTPHAPVLKKVSVMRIAIVAKQRAQMAPSAIGFCDLLGTKHAPVLKKVSVRRILLALDFPYL